MNRFLGLALTACLFGGASLSHAQDLYNNFGSGYTYQDYTWGVGNFNAGALEYAMWFGDSSMTGAVVDSVTLALTDASDNDPYTVSVSAVDANGNPTDLYTWTGVQGNNGIQTLTVGGGGVVLTGGVEYAIHVGLVDGYTEIGGWYFSNTATDGLSFQYAGTGWYNYAGANSGAMEVTGVAPVPEPCTMIVLAGGGLLALRRRFK